MKVYRDKNNDTVTLDKLYRGIPLTEEESNRVQDEEMFMINVANAKIGGILWTS